MVRMAYSGALRKELTMTSFFVLQRVLVTFDVIAKLHCEQNLAYDAEFLQKRAANYGTNWFGVFAKWPRTQLVRATLVKMTNIPQPSEQIFNAYSLLPNFNSIFQ